MIFLLSFIVGVYYPPSIENSTGKMLKFTTLCALEIAFVFATSIPSWIIFFKVGHAIAY
jgi:hypothetical protein